MFQDIMWQGEIAGVDVALGTFKANKAYPLNMLDKVLIVFLIVHFINFQHISYVNK